MIRPAFTEIALFLAPFILYAAFLALTKAGMKQSKAWAPPRLTLLLIASLVLVVGGFWALAQFSGAPPGSTYIPAHLENGTFVPGTTQ